MQIFKFSVRLVGVLKNRCSFLPGRSALIIDEAKLSEQLNLPGRETNVTGVEFCTRTRLYSQVFVVVRTGLVQSYVKKNHRTGQSPRNYKKITEHLTDFTVTLSQVEDEKQFSCFPGELTVRTAQFHSSFHQNSSDSQEYPSEQLNSQEYPSEQLGFPGVQKFLTSLDRIRTAQVSQD